MKFFFLSDNFDANNASPNIVKAVNALTNHYNLEQQNVNTSAGTGNIYTPITHHNNEYVDPNLIGKHLVEDHLDKNIPKPNHPVGKTSTISNTSYYVEKSFLYSEDPNIKVEFKDRSSILKRIDEDNLINHYKYYSSQVDKQIFNIMDGTPVTIQDDHFEYETPINVLKDNNSIIVHFDIIEN